MSLFNEVDTGSDDAAPENKELDNINPDKADKANEASWFLDDNTPMEGERPEWLPEKFKKVSDVVKSYNELQKRLGDAPNEYDFSKGESWADPEYEGFKEFAQYAKEKRVPQDVMDKMMETVGDYLKEFEPDMEAEKQALGENYKERLQTLNQWAKSNLSQDAFYALTGSLRTADAVAAVEEIRNLMINNESKIPNNQGQQSQGYTVAELETEMRENLDKYKSNPQYREELQKKFEIATAREQNN